MDLEAVPRLTTKQPVSGVHLADDNSLIEPDATVLAHPRAPDRRRALAGRPSDHRRRRHARPHNLCEDGPARCRSARLVNASGRHACLAAQAKRERTMWVTSLVRDRRVCMSAAGRRAAQARGQHMSPRMQAATPGGPYLGPDGEQRGLEGPLAIARRVQVGHDALEEGRRIRRHVNHTRRSNGRPRALST